MAQEIRGEKNPTLAVLLNIIPFAIGYFYIGQWLKAINQILLLAAGIGWVIWIISWFDVHKQAIVLQNGGAINQLTFFSNAANKAPTAESAPAQPSSQQPAQPQKKACLSCGQMVDVRYSVCPFCQKATSKVGQGEPAQTSEY